MRILLVFLILASTACDPTDSPNTSGGHPPFDYQTPDTKNNIFHYENLIHVDITPDVTNLYTYGDEIGIDASYYLAFECNPETAQAIIDSNDMQSDCFNITILNNGFKMSWWDLQEIKTLPQFCWSNDNETYFKHFWYDPQTKRAFFMDFDI